ncbi:unnamed protein product [Schistosoma margrebowiei]|uniref:RNA helicase n=1 Tax=Schistosoma margrebowiei TaxID=48269 RepID=A0A183N4H5_9TREM|nr:unnamed protein product [Schistosoma margrebowiei]
MCVVREDLTEWLQHYLFSTANACPIEAHYLLCRLASGLWLSRLAYKLHYSILESGCQIALKSKSTHNNNNNNNGHSYEFLRGAVSNRDLKNLTPVSLPSFPSTLTDCAKLPLGPSDLCSFSSQPTTYKRNSNTSSCDMDFPKENISLKPRVADRWIARDNVSAFIKWCKDLGVPETILFETNGLMNKTEEKNVLLTLMEVARIASRYGLTDLPYLVRMEREIDELEAKHSQDQSEINRLYHGSNNNNNNTNHFTTHAVINLERIDNEKMDNCKSTSNLEITVNKRKAKSPKSSNFNTISDDNHTNKNSVQSRFRHPSGDLVSLLLVYRGFIKATKDARSAKSVNSKNHSQSNIDSSIQSPSKCKLSKRNSKLQWCRANFINRSRLETAVRVRGQLKQITQSTGLTNYMHSCGTNVEKIVQAFLLSGFQDQVVILSELSKMYKGDTQRLIKNSRHPVYVQSKTINLSTNSPQELLIHPESQLYTSSLNNPPPCLLFIEAVTSSEYKFQCNNTIEQNDRVFMRHVSIIDQSWLSLTENIPKSILVNCSSNQTNRNFPLKMKITSSDFEQPPSNKKRRIIHNNDDNNVNGNNTNNKLPLLQPTLKYIAPNNSNDNSSSTNIYMNNNSLTNCNGLIRSEHMHTQLSRNQKRRLAKRRKRCLTLPLYIAPNSSNDNSSSTNIYMNNNSLTNCNGLIRSEHMHTQLSRNQKRRLAKRRKRCLTLPFDPGAYVVWNQGSSTPLSGLSVSNNSIKAPEIRFSSSQFCKQHPCREKTNPTQFPWLSSPKPSSIEAGIKLLLQLGAVVVDDDEVEPLSSKCVQETITSTDSNKLNDSLKIPYPLSLTVLGRLMSAFPLEPRFSRTLISAAYLGCLIEILSIISMLYVCPVFYVPVEKRNEFSDVSLVKFFSLFKKNMTLR